MSEITNEIATLRKRLEELEKAPLEKLGEFIANKRQNIVRNTYSKTVPLARYYDEEKVTFLQLILDALKDINKRLDALESKP